jgi:hypothetical protein
MYRQTNFNNVKGSSSMKIKQDGFSLVQVLFFVSLVSGLIYIGMGQQTVLKNMKVTTNFNNEVQEVTNHIQELLSDPYICSASVEGITIGSINGTATLPGGIKIGAALGGELTNGLRNAVIDPLFDPSSPRPGVYFYRPQGQPHVVKNTEIRPGVEVANINLVNDGVRDFIRIKFKAVSRTASSKIGGEEINKDFFLTGKKNAGNTQFLECSTNQYVAGLREACISMNGVFDDTTKLCKMTDLVPNPKLTKVWIYTNGTVNFQPNTTILQGSVSCECNQKKCGRSAMPCRCNLPSCDTVSGCGGGSCVQAPMSPENYDRCVDRVLGICVNWQCRYRAQCGGEPPPDGYIVQDLK